jgi:hypothetical protein
MFIFDWIFYINRYPELYDLGINNKEKAIKHWCYNGIKENKLFNENYMNWDYWVKCNKYNPEELYNKLYNNNFEYLNNIKFKIVTSNLIESIAINIQKTLKKYNIVSDIIYQLTDEDENNDDYYIIIYNNFNKPFLPKKYILYVVEQSTSHFFKNNDYLNLIKNANYIWDFCVKNKTMFENYPFSNYYYLACPFIKSNINIININNKYDIFFYGTLNHRRRNILNKLKDNKYNIYILDNIRGNERDEIIKQSKIILNLHFYNEAGLETCRLNEVLQFNKLVISVYPFSLDILKRY